MRKLNSWALWVRIGFASVAMAIEASVSMVVKEFADSFRSRAVSGSPNCLRSLISLYGFLSLAQVIPSSLLPLFEENVGELGSTASKGGDGVRYRGGGTPKPGRKDLAIVLCRSLLVDTGSAVGGGALEGEGPSSPLSTSSQSLYSKM